MINRNTWGSCAVALACGVAACQGGASPASEVDAGQFHPPTPFPVVGNEIGSPFISAGSAGAVAFPGSGPDGAGVPTPLQRPDMQADVAPPPISGGTLLVTHDGTLLVAADPDRDQLYFVDNVAHTLLAVRPLSAGDVPGRLVEDAQGNIHVVLRGGHGIASLGRDPQSPITRRAVCDLPRGIAYDATQDALQVACAEGKLVTVPAAISGTVIRSVAIDRDARDVIVRGDRLFVTNFRSAELLELDANGAVMQRHVPATFEGDLLGLGDSLVALPPVAGTASVDSAAAPSIAIAPPGASRALASSNSPTTAWRAIDVPGKGIAMVHERASDAAVQTQPGGYGAGSGCGSGIVSTSVTTGLDGANPRSADVPSMTLAVDIASDPDGVLMAMIAAGNYGSLPQVMLFSLTGSSPLNAAAPQSTGAGAGGATDVSAGPQHAATESGGAMPPQCLPTSSTIEDPPGQVTAVTFSSAYELAVQQREPAAISFIDLRTSAIVSHLNLQQPTRFDTGQMMFHLRANSGLACASCHAEAGDDGHVWNFAGIGPRRTQTLRGGILGTEPFHWNGDMHDFPMLVHEVFVGRMSGFQPTADQTTMLSQWIDRQPKQLAQAGDVAAAARGQGVFESAAFGCNTCHSGPQLTNNMSVDVGTGAVLQVPSLRGVSYRLPLMHDGCAKTLRDRFNAGCGGDDRHGHMSLLNSGQIDDLVAYLETL
jgi:hypothetical protein